MLSSACPGIYTYSMYIHKYICIYTVVCTCESDFQKTHIVCCTAKVVQKMQDHLLTTLQWNLSLYEDTPELSTPL